MRRGRDYTCVLLFLAGGCFLSILLDCSLQNGICLSAAYSCRGRYSAGPLLQWSPLQCGRTAMLGARKVLILVALWVTYQTSYTSHRWHINFGGSKFGMWGAMLGGLNCWHSYLLEHVYMRLFLTNDKVLG